MEWRRIALEFGISTQLGVPAAILVQSKSQQHRNPFQLIDITGAGYARDFQFPDQNDVVRSLKDFKGEFVVAFFGFAQCPDVCPTTMTELAQAKKLMGAQGVRLRGIFMTVDPERDTAEMLKSYVVHFDAAFVAPRSTQEQLKRAAAEFRIRAQKNPGASATSYTIDHSAASFVCDPQGQLRLYARYRAGAAALASDARLLLGGA
ncbi:SCO family protein [Variovorax paradoxus]|uniref:SCO family protein n=1 Tax=Variovorax paradoxus TaxID=34073 RepID=UPI0009EB3C70